jgi:hypothetical protein
MSCLRVKRSHPQVTLLEKNQKQNNALLSPLSLFIIVYKTGEKENFGVE